jgi:hypothetical protein
VRAGAKCGIPWRGRQAALLSRRGGAIDQRAIIVCRTGLWRCTALRLWGCVAVCGGLVQRRGVLVLAGRAVTGEVVRLDADPFFSPSTQMRTVLYGKKAANLYTQAFVQNTQARALYQESEDTYYRANDAASYDDWRRARHQWDYFYNRH